MTQEKEYFAFISYKREDEKWAKWLANELEHYHLPTTMNGKDLPKNLRPIFRDVDELSAGNLPEQIYHALSISKNLIVVCSPRSAKSEWVNKEVEDFINIKGGKAGNIYPFIIEGIPFSKNADKECFPEKLRNLSENEERLGGNINEQGGRNAAVVKIIAGMLGIGFDSLWQKYEREKKRKRWMIVGGALLLALVSLGIGTFIAYQNKELDARNKEVIAERDRANIERNRANSERYRAESANASLLLANDSIKRQYTLIEQQKNEIAAERDNVKSANWKMMENQARMVAEKAKKEIRNDNVYESVLALMEMIPIHDERPFVPEIETALREAYDSLHSANWTYRLIDIQVDEAYMSDTEKYIIVAKTPYIYVYDLNNLLLKTHIELQQKVDNDVGYRTYLSKDEKKLYVADGAGVIYFSIPSGNLLGKVLSNDYNNGKKIIPELYRSGKDCNESDVFAAIHGSLTPINDWATSLFGLHTDVEILDYTNVNNKALIRNDIFDVALFDCKSKMVIRSDFFPSSQFESIGEFSDCSFSKDGKKLALSHTTNGSLVYDIANSTTEYFNCNECHHYSNWFRFSNSDKLLHSSRTISRLDIIDGKSLKVVDSILPRHDGYVWDAYMTAMEDKCLVMMDNEVYLYYKKINKANVGIIDKTDFVELKNPLCQNDTIINGRFLLTVSDEGINCTDLKGEYKEWSHTCYYGSDIIGFAHNNRYVFLSDHHRWISYFCIIDLASGVEIFSEDKLPNVYGNQFYNPRTEQILFENYDGTIQFLYDFIPIGTLVSRFKKILQGMKLHNRERREFFLD